MIWITVTVNYAVALARFGLGGNERTVLTQDEQQNNLILNCSKNGGGISQKNYTN